jgi:hypothetical protein
MSSKIVMPARPKPGRKPIAQEDAADKRKVQNRVAQRNFRDKRQQKLVETQAELDRVREESRVLNGNLMAEVQKLKDQLREKDAMIEQLQAANQRDGQDPRQTTLTGMGPALRVDSNVQHARNPITPPDDSGQYEIDFTAAYARPSTLKHSSSSDDFDLGGSTCGFCTDAQNCACRQGAQEAADATPQPGNCAGCRADPRRAQACRDLTETPACHAQRSSRA